MKVFRGKGDKRTITTTTIKDSLVKTNKNTEKGGPQMSCSCLILYLTAVTHGEAPTGLIPKPVVAPQAS